MTAAVALAVGAAAMKARAADDEKAANGTISGTVVDKDGKGVEGVTGNLMKPAIRRNVVVPVAPAAGRAATVLAAARAPMRRSKFRLAHEVRLQNKRPSRLRGGLFVDPVEWVGPELNRRHMDFQTNRPLMDGY